LQYGLHNKPKLIKIIAKASSKSNFAHLYLAFDNVFFKQKKRGKNQKKPLKRKNVT